MVLFTMMADFELSAMMGMSYVYPAVGGFAKHVSTATPTARADDVHCKWKSRHLCEGAGPLPHGDGRDGRWICALSKTGPPIYLKKVDYNKKEWNTQRPPDMYDPAKECEGQKIWKQLLSSRDWLDESGNYRGPQREMFARPLSKRKGKGKMCGEAESDGKNDEELGAYNDLLIQDPWARKDGAGKDTPFSRLAAEFVVDTEDFPWYEHLTKRIITKRRSNVANYKQRVFTDNEATLRNFKKGDGGFLKSNVNPELPSREPGCDR